MGVTIWTQQLSGRETYRVLLPEIEEGVYLLQLVTDNNSIVFKLVVEH